MSAPDYSAYLNTMAKYYAGQQNAFGRHAYADGNVTPIRPHRTPEEITAQLEARYAEMEAEANTPAMKWPCETCRYRDYSSCKHPLIVGVARERKRHFDYRNGDADLCGPEKALWEPIPNLWQSFTNWIAKLFERN